MPHVLQTVGAVAFALLVFSCAPAPKQPPEPKTLQHVFYHRTGGFAGVNDRVEVQPDGSAGVARRGERPREFRLTRGQVELLRDVMQGFASLKSDYPAPRQLADGFKYELRYGGKTVRASEGNPDVPPRLREAWLMLDAIASQHP